MHQPTCNWFFHYIELMGTLIQVHMIKYQIGASWSIRWNKLGKVNHEDGVHEIGVTNLGVRLSFLKSGVKNFRRTNGKKVYVVMLFIRYIYFLV